MSVAASANPRFTYADYLVWVEGRFELINGDVFDMSPAPSRRHQQVLGELAFQVHAFFRGRRCQVYMAPFDVRLPSSVSLADEDIDTVVQPDLSIICDHDKLDERGCVGAPDWVIEIQSPSTAARDQVTKRDLYELHGVREYWLVDPAERTLTRFRLDEEGRYAEAVSAEARGKSPSVLFPDLEIDWQAVFAD